MAAGMGNAMGNAKSAATDIQTNEQRFSDIEDTLRRSVGMCRETLTMWEGNKPSEPTEKLGEPEANGHNDAISRIESLSSSLETLTRNIQDATR